MYALIKFVDVQPNLYATDRFSNGFYPDATMDKALALRFPDYDAAATWLDHHLLVGHCSILLFFT